MFGLLSALLGLGRAYLQRREDRETRLIDAQARLQEAQIKARAALPGYTLLIAPIVLASAFYYSSVLVYSVLWCRDCAFPQNWTIAKLPEPVDSYFYMVFVYLFGVAILRKR